MSAGMPAGRAQQVGAGQRGVRVIGQQSGDQRACTGTEFEDAAAQVHRTRGGERRLVDGVSARALAREGRVHAPLVKRQRCGHVRRPSMRQRPVSRKSARRRHAGRAARAQAGHRLDARGRSRSTANVGAVGDIGARHGASLHPQWLSQVAGGCHDRPGLETDRPSRSSVAR